MGLFLQMTWQERPAPNRPTMQSLVEEEVHLVLYCNACHRQVRSTPWEAVELFGAGCTMIGARRKMKCSWCGEREKVEARPCTLDWGAKKLVEAARRHLMTWPSDEGAKQAL